MNEIEQIRQFLDKENIKLEWFAGKAGVHRTTISQWTKGTRQPSYSTKQAILGAASKLGFKPVRPNEIPS